jgi:integrase
VIGLKIKQHVRGNYYTTLTINGKKNFIYGNTPEEVEVKYTEMKYKHHQGYNVTDNPTMEEYMILWYNTFKKGKGAIKTQEMYQNCINNHINPALGSYKVKEITGTQVQKLLNGITSSRSLAHKVRITLNQIFKQAIADRLITFNPVTSCKVIAPDEPKREFLNPIQRNLMLSILDGHRFYPIAFTTLYTGMRMGESIALLWKDIDFENTVIRVTKATEFDHSKPKAKDPKTKRGFREIPMPKELSDYIKQHHKKTKKSLYVFPGHAGGPMGQSEIKRIMGKAKKKINKWFKDKQAAIEKNNELSKEQIEENKKLLEYKFNLTFRTLRHTYCTGLFDAGVDEVSAAEIMGHDRSIMREVYTHIQEQRKKKTAIKLNSIYKESEESNIVELKESK